MAELTAQHELEWETSPWPLLLSIGTLFLLPLSFSFYFVYNYPMMAILSLGIGVPLTIISIAGWIGEGVGRKEEPGFSIAAMPLFIVAEAFIFLALFAAYWVMRLKSSYWPPPGTPEFSVLVPVIMTIILISSSFTIHFGEVRLEQGDIKGYLKWLLATIVLGSIFLGISITEYSHFLSEGFDFKTNAYSTAFYSITGFHGSHVLVGIGMFICILIPALLGRISKSLVRSASMYWHFVDIIWLFVVTQVYFW